MNAEAERDYRAARLNVLSRLENETSPKCNALFTDYVEGGGEAHCAAVIICDALQIARMNDENVWGSNGFSVPVTAEMGNQLDISPSTVYMISDSADTWREVAARLRKLWAL